MSSAQESTGDQPRPTQRRISPRAIFTLVGYLVCSLMVTAGLLEFVAFACSKITHAFRPDPGENPMGRSPWLTSVSWGRDFLKEEQSRWNEQHGYYVPFRIWGVDRWHGRYVNTDDTELGTWRRTINVIGKNCVGRPIEQIWVFGGSTVYGTGVPDWATLPSLMSRLLNAQGNCVEVTNLGVEGYVTNQEVLLLIERLKASTHPDAVIFYDGVNESYVGALSPGIPTAHASLDQIEMGVENTARNKLAFLNQSYAVKLTRRLLKGWDDDKLPVHSDRTDDKAMRTLANYEANLVVVRALAGTYHFNAYFFWQPSMFSGRKPLDPFEQEIFRARTSGNGAGFGAALTAVYALADSRASASGEFVFLGRLFDGVKDSLYIDGWMHLSPLGNELAARAIVNTIQIGGHDSEPTHSL